MYIYIPNFVSYDLLLQSICDRPVTGKTNEEVEYIVDLAETLCRLMREVEEQTGRRAS
jgi:hypothetical protein